MCIAPSNGFPLIASSLCAWTIHGTFLSCACNSEIKPNDSENITADILLFLQLRAVKYSRSVQNVCVTSTNQYHDHVHRDFMPSQKVLPYHSDYEKKHTVLTTKRHKWLHTQSHVHFFSQAASVPLKNKASLLPTVPTTFNPTRFFPTCPNRPLNERRRKKTR